MSTLPDNELDLEKLFLPAWAQESATNKSYANYEGESDRPDRREGRRGPRPPRRDGPGGPPREGNRPAFGDRRGPRPGGPGRPGAGPGRREGGGFGRGPQRGPQGGGRDWSEPREYREPPPLPEVNLALLPEARGVESLARQIRMSGRAYPLFDIAQMVLQKPERHVAQFSVKKNAEGQPVQPLFLCALDDTLWLSEDEAVEHVLRKHFATFYQADRTATEPPKGKYTFVAQCGISGVILGPPNHHDYQNQLRKLHADRFSRMPFEVYKSRVKIVREEEVVKKWVEDQSWKTEYICLNMPEPQRLGNMEAVERHFRENHKDIIIKPVETHTLGGVAARNLRCAPLSRMVRQVWEDQRRFPLQTATTLSQQFAGHGLQFFKVNKTFTHVCVARPHYLDLEATPVSEGVKRIVDFINAHAKTNRRQLIEALAPSPAVIPVAPASTPAPAPQAAEPTAPAAPEAEVPAGETPAAPAAATPAPASAAPVAPAPTAEQTALVADLHWLIHQGHVIEFATGILETAKKPLPKPPKPEPKPAAQKETKPAEPAATEAAVQPEPAEAAPVSEPAAAPTEASASPAEAAPAQTEAAPAPPVEASVEPVPASPAAAATEPTPAPSEDKPVLPPTSETGPAQS